MVSTSEIAFSVSMIAGLASATAVSTAGMMLSTACSSLSSSRTTSSSPAIGAQALAGRLAAAAAAAAVPEEPDSPQAVVRIAARARGRTSRARLRMDARLLCPAPPLPGRRVSGGKPRGAQLNPLGRRTKAMPGRGCVRSVTERRSAPGAGGLRLPAPRASTGASTGRAGRRNGSCR